jgi:hypothetical protein
LPGAFLFYAPSKRGLHRKEEADMENKGMEKQSNIKHRVITMLDRDELEFLDKLGKDALFSTGHKLPITKFCAHLSIFPKK